MSWNPLATLLVLYLLAVGPGQGGGVALQAWVERVRASQATSPAKTGTVEQVADCRSRTSHDRLAPTTSTTGLCTTLAADADAGSAIGDDAPFIEAVSKRRRKKAQPGAGQSSAEVHAMSDGAGSGGPCSSSDDDASDAPTLDVPMPDGWVKLLGAADEAARPALLAEWKLACVARPRARRSRAVRSKATASAKASR